MFIENFREDFKTYIKQELSNSKNAIGEVERKYDTESTITGIIAILKKPREIVGVLGKQYSEYVLYSDIDQTSKRGDFIIDDLTKYEVLACRKIQGLGGEEPCNAHYLILIE